MTEPRRYPERWIDCLICGAMVEYDSRETHLEWHRKRAEVTEITPPDPAPLLTDAQLETWRFDAEDNDEPITAEAARTLIATAIDTREQLSRAYAAMRAVRARRHYTQLAGDDFDAILRDHGITLPPEGH